MAELHSTCWTMIDGAARGKSTDRQEFARIYIGPVKAYLTRRWRGKHGVESIDDAVQEVFAECFKSDGPLARVDRAQGAFRPYLYGVVRNVARVAERRQFAQRERSIPSDVDLDQLAVDEETLSSVFDRAWAEAIVRGAAQLQKEAALHKDTQAQRRVELLHLRFYENKPIREIALLWEVEAAHLHREYAKAREEFRHALGEVVRAYDPEPSHDVEHRVNELIDALRKTSRK